MKQLIPLKVVLSIALVVGLCPGFAYAREAVASGSAIAELAEGALTSQESAASDASADIDVEPNDVMEQAQDIQLGVIYAGGSSSYDDAYDWYRFTLQESGLLTISAVFDSNMMCLYDSNGEQLSRLRDTENVSAVTATERLTSGTYYIRIGGRYGKFDHWSGNSRESYSFQMTCEPAFETFKETPGGSNNTMATASDIALEGSYRAQLACNDDCDYYALSLPTSGRVTVSARFRLDAACVLLNGRGAKVWSGNSELQSGQSYQDEAWDLDLVSGKYYLKVSSGSTGVYSFNVGFTSADEAFTESWDVGDNSTASANSIEVGKPYRGQIAINDTTDVYGFSINDTGIVLVSAEAGFDGTTFAILDEFGDELAKTEGDWNEETGKATLSWRYSCGKGDFFLKVENAYGYGEPRSNTGAYDFSVKELPNIADAKVSGVKSATYTGRQCKVSFKVAYGGSVLRRGIDYEVSYSNNVKAGSNAKAIISGIGEYAGKKTVRFTIDKAKQPMKVRGKSCSVNTRYLPSHSIALTSGDICKVSNSVGKVTFKKVSVSKRAGKFTVKPSGAVVVKRGTPKGTYKLKIKATAKGDANYKPCSKTFTAKVVAEYW